MTLDSVLGYGKPAKKREKVGALRMFGLSPGPTAYVISTTFLDSPQAKSYNGGI